MLALKHVSTFPESLHKHIFNHGSNIIFNYQAYNQSNPASGLDLESKTEC
jgi:hypothetical protein